MFQRKTDEIVKGLPNVFGTAYDILMVGYDAESRDRTLRQMMQLCHREHIKLKKNKCHFRCTKIPFFGEVLSRSTTRPKEAEYTKRDVPLLTKKNYNPF